MIAALLAGAGVGVGLVVVVGALLPARPSLAVASARLRQPGQGRERGPAPLRGRARWTNRLADAFDLPARFGPSVRCDLRIVGRSLDDHVAASVATGLGSAALVPAMAAVMWMGGVAVPLAVPAAASLLGAAAGSFVPTLSLRSIAAERRRSFRHALSSFLDLVAVTLASGAGIESALARGAGCGRGWAFSEIGQALVAGRLRGETPWAALDRLGAELAVPELRELAASVALAGEDGARVRASVAARARSLRSRGLTDTEADAQAATERMSLPIVLLMAGFMVFVIYPALARIVTAI
ncbi:MAG: type II secretion system F family protein [Actinomycetota bacterium]